MEIRTNEPMARHTSFRVGGPADRFVIPESETELREAVLDCKKSGQPWYMIGNGSNLLVSDQGYAGIVLVVGKHMSRIEVRDCYLEAEAGALMSQVAKAAKEHGLTGLDNSTMEYGYRTSVIQNQSFVVTKVTFRLQPGDPEQIAAKMEELAIRRREKQPLEYPSAGSTFKRPEGHFAGQLIMEAGLRGYSVGGAKVSEKHCGFIINTGNATAEDVKDVIWEVQRRVKERFHVELEPEIKFL